MADHDHDHEKTHDHSDEVVKRSKSNAEGFKHHKDLPSTAFHNCTLAFYAHMCAVQGPEETPQRAAKLHWKCGWRGGTKVPYDYQSVAFDIREKDLSCRDIRRAALEGAPILAFVPNKGAESPSTAPPKAVPAAKLRSSIPPRS